ncbi:long-chain-fatty-acid--CoA ligase [Paenibacillus sp. 481]|uniref:long-chain-fatty-acid--CoA ligase n=1 Tax=Paenibacillus sp. 481 TaxID=2835869 RepID=UPI001E31AC1E|nr:long-chain fatty acid--CoA ligase [Paenibacillus sp. 481]UHA73860.1 long-chain fatty acid--CoA ligase [Paenibacillus sp. 481]
MQGECTQRPWLRHYPPDVAHSFKYPRQNVAQLLVDAAAGFPSRNALSFMGSNMTYSELLDASTQFANGLLDLGVRTGDRVAIMLPNCPQLVIAYYGTLLMGGIVVMTNPLYMEGELTHQLNDSGAKTIVTLDLLHSRVLNVKRQTSLQTIIVASIREYLPFPKNILYPLKVKRAGQSLHVPSAPGILRFKSWLRKQRSAAVFHDVEAEQDIAVLQYTGGTTGVSKGVMLSHYNLVANTVQVSNWFSTGRKGEEVLLAALPCFHVFGLTVVLNLSAHVAGELVLIPRFETELVLRTIEKKRVTLFPGAPTMYIAINHHPDVKSYDLSSLRACVSGSAPLPLEVQERFEALTGGRLVEGYGLTEASPVTHANNVRGYRKIGTVGIPFQDTDARIVHPETGEQLAVGEIGELAVRGPQVMLGYWNRPDDTAAVLKDGWLLTGDMAICNEEAMFAIVDRKKDMIIASGFKVFPREVEEVLYEHPDVKEAAIIGAVDAYRGETVKAFIVPREGSQVTAESIEQWCRARLAAFKVPRLIEFRTELPKTMIGKVLRRKLIEEESLRTPRIDE